VPIFHAPETAYGKELWKWDHYEDEQNPIDPSIRGMRPRGYRPYPASMYRVVERNPLQMEFEIAESDVQRRNLEQRGFVHGGQLAALEAYDGQQKEFATLAANRAYNDRKMSPEAQAEAAAFDAEADGHQPEIPAVPIKRRQGWPKGKPRAKNTEPVQA